MRSSTVDGLLIRASLIGLAVAVLAGGGALWASGGREPGSAPLDPHIPNERALIAQGLSGTPAPGQPAGPIAVDRVLDDGVATYIQFHTTSTLDFRGDWLPRVADDSGAVLDAGVGGAVPWTGWDVPFAPLSALPWDRLPWHPPVLRRGFITVQGALPLTARAAVIRFPFGETVRVPLNLSALARRQVSHPGTLASANIISVRLQDVDELHLTYVFTATLAGSAESLRLNSPAGPIQASSLGGACQRYSAKSVVCNETWVFPPQRSGTHLSMVIPEFVLGDRPGRQRTVTGPWRLSVVVP